jgi:hypothetical protein
VILRRVRAVLREAMILGGLVIAVLLNVVWVVVLALLFWSTLRRLA